MWAPSMTPSSAGSLLRLAPCLGLGAVVAGVWRSGRVDRRFYGSAAWRVRIPSLKRFPHVVVAAHQQRYGRGPCGGRRAPCAWRWAPCLGSWESARALVPGTTVVASRSSSPHPPESLAYPCLVPQRGRGGASCVTLCEGRRGRRAVGGCAGRILVVEPCERDGAGRGCGGLGRASGAPVLMVWPPRLLDACSHMASRPHLDST